MSVREKIVELRGIGKRYGGKRRGRWALKDADLSFSGGEVIGFIGPNGAGKTTLIKILCGLSHATEGEITVLGEDLRKRTVTPDGIGLVLESPSFIPYLSGRKNLKLLADIRGRIGEQEINETLLLVGLDPKDKRPTRSYSLGMRQRLGLAQALMEKPKLLILDEPTNGLDPTGIIELRNLIRRLAQEENVAVFLASHLLTEVEQVCDRVLLVKSGEIIKELDQREQDSPPLKITVTDTSDLAKLRNWADGSNIRINETDSPLTIELDSERSTPEVVRELIAAKVNIEGVGRARRSLEREFLALIGDSE